VSIISNDILNFLITRFDLTLSRILREWHTPNFILQPINEYDEERNVFIDNENISEN